MQKLWFISAALLVAGCSAHNPFIVSNTTDSKPVSTNKYPAHTNKVYVTEGGLPENVKYDVLENIEVGKVWYGSGNDVKQSMAERARAIGADAVINVSTWHQPSGFSWSAPHGSGKAVKILQPDVKTVQFSKGEWY